MNFNALKDDGPVVKQKDGL